MIIYYIIAFLIVLTSIFHKKIQEIVSISILFFILCFRSPSVGNDLIPYLNLFKRIGSIDIWNYNMEKGYLLLNKVIYLVNSNPRIFIVISSMIICIILSKFIQTNSEIVWLSYFLFVVFGFYEMTFNIIRQFLAMGICWMSLEKIKKREILKFLIYYGIAINFHQTAIFFIIVYFIYPLKINIKYYIGIALSVIINFTIFPYFLPRLLSYFPKYYIRYSDNLLETGGGLKLLFVLTILLIVSLYFRKSSEEKIFYHLLSFAVILQTLAYNFSILTRIVSYYSIAIVIIIPNLLNQRLIKIKHIGFILIIIIGYIYYTIILKLDYSGIVPYQFM